MPDESREAPARDAQGRAVETRVAVTRAMDDAVPLVAALEAVGLVPISTPLLRIDRFPPDALVAAMKGGERFDWLVCTSRHAVDALSLSSAAMGVAPRDLGFGHVAAVGGRTADALTALGLPVDVVPDVSDAAHLAEAMLAWRTNAAPRRVLFPRANDARETLPDRLRDAGWEVVDVSCYDTRPDAAGGERLCRALDEGMVAAITLASGSAARALAHLVPRALWSRARLVSIGSTTTADAASCGLSIAAQASAPNVASLADATRRILLDTFTHA